MPPPAYEDCFEESSRHPKGASGRVAQPSPMAASTVTSASAPYLHAHMGSPTDARYAATSHSRHSHSHHHHPHPHRHRAPLPPPLRGLPAPPLPPLPGRGLLRSLRHGLSRLWGEQDAPGAGDVDSSAGQRAQTAALACARHEQRPARREGSFSQMPTGDVSQAPQIPPVIPAMRGQPAADEQWPVADTIGTRCSDSSAGVSRTEEQERPPHAIALASSQQLHGALARAMAGGVAGGLAGTANRVSARHDRELQPTAPVLPESLYSRLQAAELASALSFEDEPSATGSVGPGYEESGGGFTDFTAEAQLLFCTAPPGQLSLGSVPLADVMSTAAAASPQHAALRAQD